MTEATLEPNDYTRDSSTGGWDVAITASARSSSTCHPLTEARDDVIKYPKAFLL